MNKLNTSTDGFLQKYKELIVTTITEIKKWYELMIGINEKVKVQADQLGKLEESLETHLDRSAQRFIDQGKRIKTLEFEIVLYNRSLGKTILRNETSKISNGN